MSLSFRLLREANGRTELGESPVWDSRTGDVWWIDIDGRKLLRTRSGSNLIQEWDTPEYPGFVVLMAPGRPAIGMETGIFSFDIPTSTFKRIVVFEQPGHRFNDATVDPDGRLWASTMALDANPGSGAVHVITNDLVIETVAEGLSIPNGLAVDLKRGRLFYSDSHRDVQSIWVRHVEPGSTIVGEPRLFASTATLNGRPDGAALDEAGHYWIAGVDGSEVYVFGLEGELHTVIPVPFPAPTKIAFIGVRGRDVAVTSKNMGENGGYLAFASLPDTFASGITQPYWANEAWSATAAAREKA